MGCEAAEVDVAFVQELEHRPKSAVIVAGEEVPVIDLSLLNSPNSGDSDALSDVVAQVEAACRDWGFFQVINHGLPPEVLTRLESASREFFALPPEEKQKVRRDEANPLGYYETEHTKNVRDWKEVFDFLVEDTTVIPASHESLEMLKNQWPEYPPELKEVSNKYGRGVEELAHKLVELISLSLGLPAERLNGYFKDGTSFIRLNHYPQCPYPELVLGVGPHKDSGALTVLSQDDVGGLEVKRRSDGEWIRVRPVPGAYIINVGDIIQVWSNDKYQSAEHRVVVNSSRERFSIPFFLSPSHELMVKPVEELLSDENPPKYREYNLGKFFKTRRLSNYKKLDVENIQIYHFKTA